MNCAPILDLPTTARTTSSALALRRPIRCRSPPWPRDPQRPLRRRRSGCISTFRPRPRPCRQPHELHSSMPPQEWSGFRTFRRLAPRRPRWSPHLYTALDPTPGNAFRDCHRRDDPPRHRLRGPHPLRRHRMKALTGTTAASARAVFESARPRAPLPGDPASARNRGGLGGLPSGAERLALALPVAPGPPRRRRTGHCGEKGRLLRSATRKLQLQRGPWPACVRAGLAPIDLAGAASRRAKASTARGQEGHLARRHEPW